MKAFKKRIILSFIYIVIVQFSIAQSYTISGPACAVPTVPYTYTFSGSYPANPWQYCYLVGGSIVGYTANTVTVVWQGYGDGGPTSLNCFYGVPVTYNVAVAASWSNTISLTGYTISGNSITAASASYSAEPGTACNFTYTWTDAGDGTEFNTVVGTAKDLNLINGTKSSLTLRREMRVAGYSSFVWSSNVIGIKSIIAYAGQNVGTLTPGPAAVCASASYRWWESTDGTNWTLITNNGYPTYNPGVLHDSRYYKVDIICSGSTNVTIFKITLNSPLNAGAIAASNPGSAFPGTIINQQAATGGGCSTYAYQWEKSTDGVNFSPIQNATGLDYTPASPFEATWYRRSASCLGSVQYSNAISFKQSIVIIGNNAGTLTPAPMGACSAASYTWYESVDGSNWTYVPNPTATYAPGMLNATHYYKTEINCGGVLSSTIFKIFVDKSFSPGAITAPAAVQPGQLPGTITSQPASGGGCMSFSYQWEQSFDGVNFTPISNATAEIYSPDYLYATTWYRRKASCLANSFYSTVAKCAVIKPLTGGTVNPASTYIAADAGVQFSTVTAAAGGDGYNLITYQWQQSTDGTNFTDITGATDASYNTFSPDKTTWFRRKAICGAETAFSNTTKAIKIEDNYVQELVAVKPGMPDNLEDYTNDLQQVQQSITYMDGLGRPVQTVAMKQSLVSGSQPKDLVTANEYDAMGRQSKQYLPFAAISDDGLRKLSGIEQQKTFYNTQLAVEPTEVNIGASASNWAFSKTVYEASPVARVTETFSPGVNWAGTNAQPQEDDRKSVKTKYLTNQPLDAVRVWNVTDVPGNWGNYTSSYTYQPGTLIKTSTTDEQGVQTITFKDHDENLVLKKVQNTAAKDNGSGSDHTGWLCTYFIYDNLQRLRAVIQPKAVKELARTNNWDLDATTLYESCFRYEYDDHHRPVRKKAPGAEEKYIVYDALDRPVLTQHASQRSKHQWVYNKYDRHGRLIITGLYTDFTRLSQSDMQAYVDAQNYPLYELPTGNFPFYTNFMSFPVYGSEQILTVNYYDNYNFTAAFAPAFAAKDNSFDTYFSSNYTTYPYPAPLVQGSATNNKLTGRWESTGPGLLQVNFFDNEGMIIQSRKTNLLQGVDVTTNQYGFTGMRLAEYFQSEKGATNPQTVKVLSEFSYDNLGRLIKVSKKTGSSLIDNGQLPNEFAIISETKYDALGRISSKKIGRQTDNAGHYLSQEMETQTFEYNIRGWLLGINRNYLGANTGDHFGFELAYDKQTSIMNNNSSSLYTGKMLNGNVNGMMWRSVGDGENRKYDYSYDGAGRLTAADFNQYTGLTFNKNAKVDFTVSNLQYDDNGNILSMKQMGLTGPTSTVVDDLAYTYISNGNRLKNVRDGVSASGNKGDFTTSLSHPHKSAKDAATTEDLRNGITDYEYDGNGNLIKDYNKDIGDQATQGITYNYLNLPERVTFKKAGATNPSTIAYIYNADGVVLKKEVSDNTTATPVVTTTLYNDGIVYVNDVLQFVGHEEGKARFTPASGTAAAKINYDYFLKDHLGNVRMILTDEHEDCIYPAATLEGSGTTAGVPNALFKEKDYYDINEANIVDKPDQNIGYANNNGVYNNNPYSDAGATTQKMYQLQASGGVAAKGLGVVLKVMSGDKINIFGKSYYNTDNSAHQNYQLPVLDLLTSFLGGPSALGAAKGVTAGDLNNIAGIAGKVGDFLNDPQRGNDADDKPKAYINYVLLDNQFNYVSSGFSRVGNINQVKDHYIIDQQTLKDIPVLKNGYLYVFCSNESPVKVYFDNLQVVHSKGALLEETHYYPFGLSMPGISDKAAKPGYAENNYKFNFGSELQHHEFADGSGLELYSTGFRGYDPQIGRFHQMDPLADINDNWSPYNFSNNNPVIFNDPMGLDTVRAAGRTSQLLTPGQIINLINTGGGTSSYIYDPSNPNADNNGLVENGITEGFMPAHTVVAKRNKKSDKAAPAAGTADAGAKKKIASAAKRGTGYAPPAIPPSNITPGTVNEGDIAAKSPGNDMRPYFMGEKPNTVDCSRFGSETAAKAGYALMRGNAVDQSNWYKKHGHWSNKLSDAQKGDHIFWSRGGGSYHTGVVSDVRMVGEKRVITVVQAQTFDHQPGSIQAHNLKANGEIGGFHQPFVGVGRYP